MRIVTLKPALDAEDTPLIVRDPVTTIPLKAEGEAKELTTHWIRRINAGDVVEIPGAETAPVAKPAKPAANAAKE